MGFGRRLEHIETRVDRRNDDNGKFKNCQLYKRIEEEEMNKAKAKFDKLMGDDKLDKKETPSKDSYADVIEGYLIAEEFFKEVSEIKRPEKLRDEDKKQNNQSNIRIKPSNNMSKDKADAIFSRIGKSYESIEDDDEDIAEESQSIPGHKIYIEKIDRKNKVYSDTHIDEICKTWYPNLHWIFKGLPESDKKRANDAIVRAYNSPATEIPGVNGGSGKLVKHKEFSILFCYDNDGTLVGAFVPTKTGEPRFIKIQKA